VQWNPGRDHLITSQKGLKSDMGRHLLPIAQELSMQEVIRIQCIAKNRIHGILFEREGVAISEPRCYN
jgi:hypothetical protein